MTINSGYNTTTASLNTSVNSLNAKSGGFATTGSNAFTGNQTIGGTLTASGTIRGNNVLNIINQNASINLMRTITFSGSQYPTNAIIVAPNQYPGDIFGGHVIYTELGNQAGLTFLGTVATTYSPEYGSTITPMIIANGNNPAGSDTSIAWTSNGQADHWKKSNFKYGVDITGSVFQNVSASAINASTASIDLSVANYFTLTLAGNTNINVTNAKAGVTATLVINTDTGASASFSSNVKQPSGSLYVASPSGNVDIISFTAVNSSTVYAFPAQSFV